MQLTLRLGRHISATPKSGSVIEQGIQSKNMQYATRELPRATRLLRGLIAARRYPLSKLLNSLPSDRVACYSQIWVSQSRPTFGEIGRTFTPFDLHSTPIQPPPDISLVQDAASST
jgi:hypothetical protein